MRLPSLGPVEPLGSWELREQLGVGLQACLELAASRILKDCAVTPRVAAEPGEDSEEGLEGQQVVFKWGALQASEGSAEQAAWGLRVAGLAPAKEAVCYLPLNTAVALEV